MKNPYGFRLIEGSKPGAREGARGATPPHAGWAGEGGLSYAPTHSHDDLAIALRAMEERLGAMIEERERLARDLHDCVLQSLYAIGLTVETVGRGPTADRPSQIGCSDIVDQLNYLIQEVRSLIRYLESENIRDFDLGSELQLLIQTYKEISPLKIRADIEPEVAALVTNEEKRELLMIVREAISNCVRHARALHAAVSLYARGSRLRLLIADDGIGFAQEQKHMKGYGLANMSARARKLGGRLLIRSQVGKGTRILVEFSLELDLSPA